MIDNYDEIYKQFEGLVVPPDVKPQPKFTRKSLEEEVNSRRKDIKVSFKHHLVISLNCRNFRHSEVHINTCDVGTLYTPDFDFSDLDEFDIWKKTCRLKYNLQRFDELEVDLVRCDDFLHRMQVCECLTLFEEVHRMLKKGGHFLITVLDIFKLVKFISQINPTDFQKLYHYERKLYSNTDSTGLYYNRTIWTYQRLETYLRMANFKNIEINNKEKDPYKLSIKAWK